MKIDLPHYKLNSNYFIKKFGLDLGQVRTAKGLTKLIGRWSQFWSLGNSFKAENVREMDAKILSGAFDASEALICLQKCYQDQVCDHAPTHLCAGMEIRLPFTLMHSVFLAHEFGAPLGVAFHQAFCEGPHDECF